MKALPETKNACQWRRWRGTLYHCNIPIQQPWSEQIKYKNQLRIKSEAKSAIQVRVKIRKLSNSGVCISGPKAKAPKLTGLNIECVLLVLLLDFRYHEIKIFVFFFVLGSVERSKWAATGAPRHLLIASQSTVNDSSQRHHWKKNYSSS